MKSRSLGPCRICDAPNAARAFHFGAKVCKACAAFFRRTVALKLTYECRRDSDCTIYYDKRYMCKACRYIACMRVGMLPELVESKGKACERRLHFPELFESAAEHTFDVPSCSKSDCWMDIEEVIRHYVTIETDLVDRRRIAFGNCRIQDIIHDKKDCPYELGDLKLFDWKNYAGYNKFEFAMVFDYARRFLHYEDLDKQDQDILYRFSCVVDVLMGMAYYTIRRGLEKKILINTNATYYPMDPLPPTGEEPGMAKEFDSDEQFQRYKLLVGPYQHYWTTLVLPLKNLNISFAEFALLKALVCWHVAYYKFLPNDQELCSTQRNVIMRALLQVIEDREDGCGAIRMGELLLYIKPVFEHIYELLESLYMMNFFNIVEFGEFCTDMLMQNNVVQAVHRK